ncbi:glycosyltransferase family 4 protein [Cumulibacter manganitolerans]|uniref:glycosyltransferase family 4 protein n=1 Tax=Cumulibacter manganitolerans TaxID=1884992 RepID=UPI001296B516|nr:glycosyltransferase family 4 protein [Cumulibacter manganitolerans]
MKIGLLTQWYAPESGPAALPTGLAEGLAARGHDVRVLTGFPNYPHGRIARGYKQRRRLDEISDAIHVRRVALYPSHDASALRRIANYASFAASAVASGLDVLEDVDVLWVNYSPVTVSLPMFRLQRHRRIPVVVHALDLWPDTVTASGLGGRLGKPIGRVLGSWCSRIYDAADVVAYISPGVGDLLESRGVNRAKLAYAPMWADESVHVPLEPPKERRWDLRDNTLAIVYAGTLGGAQDLDTLITAAPRITDVDVTFLIAGSGTHESQLRERAERAGATNVHFLGRLDAEDMRALNADADVHYVGLNDHPLARVTMPSKVQAVLATGRPIIGALVGDVADVVRRGGGWVVAPGDDVGLEKHLREIAANGRGALAERSTQARLLYDAEFSYNQGIERIETLLTAAANRRTSD